MLAAFAALKAYFDARGWHYDADENAAAVRVGVVTKGGRYRCVATALPEVLAFYSFLPLPAIGEAQKSGLVELARINAQLVFGSFELGSGGGEIFFKTATLLPRTLEEDLIHALVGRNLATMDHYAGMLTQMLMERPRRTR